jgi:hypothetical protein
MNDPQWHVVWIDEESDGYVVRCIPHGYIGVRDTYLSAFLCAYEHDFEIRGDLTMPGYTELTR